MGSTDNVKRTFFNSPKNFTPNISNYAICVGQDSHMEFNFLNIETSITFEDSPESIIQLWTFLLKISKVSKKGGTLLVEDF